MRWKARYTKAVHKQGATRLKRVFAILPTYIDGDIVWLESYDILQLYTIDEYKSTLEDEEIIIKTARWVNISKKIISHERAA